MKNESDVTLTFEIVVLTKDKDRLWSRGKKWE